MSGLILKLSPKERVLVNGAVLENGDRRTRLSVLTPNINILRLKDALQPDQVKTPVQRVCYIAQLVLSGDAEPAEAALQILTGIEQLSQVFQDMDSREQLTKATEALKNEDFYRVLKSLRTILPREARLLRLAQ